MIYLHTLGSALISIGVKEIRPTSPMFFAALLYLGMERGRRVPRTALQEMLFPDVDERSGAHSLRQLLYKLRQLGTSLSEDASGALLDANEVAVDLSAVPDLARTQPDRLALGFLPGYVPQFSETFSEWLDRKRAFAEAEIRRALVTRLIQHRDSAQWPQVERVAQLLLGIDPYNEEATLALAEATAMAGSKAEALRILDRYEHEAGSHDLKLPASVLRRRISDRLPPSLLIARPPFVGRAEEAQALLEYIRGGLANAGGLVVIVGESGIGKTRLVEETLAVARLDGIAVYTARSKPHDVARPMSAFIELVPVLLQARGALGISPESLAHLTLLVQHKDDRSDRPLDARDDTTRSRIVVSAFRDLVEAVFAEQRFLIVVEDAQWCDPDSLRELASMGSALSTPLVIVLTARALDSATRDLLLSREAVLQKVLPLSDAAVAELACNLVPEFRESAHREVTLQWYVRRAGGNPLFLRMLCADFAANRPFHVPSDLVALTTSRIERLNVLARRILEFSALLGRHASKGALRELAQCTPREFLDAVQLLEDEGFLQLGDGSYSAHDLVGECALQRLQPATLSLLHDYVARVLEAEYEKTHDASIMWDCAEHWARSGDGSKAVAFLKQCAYHALDMGRAHSALELLKRAERFAVLPKDAADLYTAMMVAGKSAGNWPYVFAAADSFSRLPEDSHPQHGRHELYLLEASWERGSSMHDATAGLLACVTSPIASTDHRLESASLLLRIAHEYGKTELAHKVYEIVEPLLEGAHGCQARLVPLIYHASFGDTERAMTLARSARAWLPEVSSLAQRFNAALNVGIALCFAGAHEEGIEVIDSYFQAAGRLALPEWQVDFAAPACWLCIDREEFTAAAVWFDRLQQIMPKVAPRSRRMLQYLACQCELALAKSGVERALSAFQDMRTLNSFASERINTYIASFEIRLRQADPSYRSDAAELDTLHALYKRARSTTQVDYLVAALGEALWRNGQVDAAATTISEYLQHHRRERGRPSPSLSSLLERCGATVPESYPLEQRHPFIAISPSLDS